MGQPLLKEIDINKRFSEEIKKDFPLLSSISTGGSFAYLDNGATTQKPNSVIKRMFDFDAHEYASVHRGAYEIGEEATEQFESARQEISKFINSSTSSEIIFTSGATAAINMVAYGWGRKFLKKGDEVVITEMEHHANFVPWQILCKEKGAELIVAPVTNSGEIDLSAFSELVTTKTKIVAVTHVSNVLGTINPVKEITKIAHAKNAIVLIDGAQAVGHMAVDVRNIGCDFYAFSGHKMYGPTGVGVLYGKKNLLNEMNPFITGGEMILRVTKDYTLFEQPPKKFEAGTPPTTQAIGLGEAVRYIQTLTFDRITTYENELRDYLLKTLADIPEVLVIGDPKKRAAIVSFLVAGAHAHDVVTLLDGSGLALRGGHHCAQPLMERFNTPALTRASLSFYNSTDEIDRLGAELKKIAELFS